MTDSQMEWFASLKDKSGWHTAIVIITAALAYMVSLSIYNPAPIKPADVVVFVEHPKPGVTVLMEVRSIVGLRADESIYVSRRLYREGKPQEMLVLEGGNFRTLAGEFPVAHAIPLPKWVHGRWCSAVTYSWWPAWSQREFSLDAQEVCFETSEYE